MATTIAQGEKRASAALVQDWSEALKELASAPWKNSSESETLALIDRTGLKRMQLVVMNANHKPVFRYPQEPEQESGESMQFISHQYQANDVAHPAILQGVLQAGSVNAPAIAARRTDGDGSVVISMPQAQVRAETASTLESLPVISILTWFWTMALLSVASYLIVARVDDRSTKELGKALSDGLRQRQNLLRTRDAVIFGLAKLAESRDPDTGDHLDRISVYSTTLADAISRHPDYSATVTPVFVRNIGISSVLHDIGKVGIEDRILLKPGRFTPGERAEMETHCRIAADCLREIEQRLGRTNFLEMAREIALCHHERWDGSGYPQGMRGEEIPLSARLVAIADVYDALSSRRVYKDACSHEDCVTAIREGAGTQFDPQLVEIWLGISDRFAEIAQRYADKPVSRSHDNRQTVGAVQSEVSETANVEVGA